MKNLKIRVNSADESKEVQELFLGLGYVKDNWLWSGYSDYPIELRTRDGGYSDFKLNAGNAIERKEITLPELRDMVILKRNDVGDATHEDKDDPEFKYRLIDNNWHVITEENPVWRKSSVTLEESPLFIKPIEKNMNTLDTDQDEPFLTPETTLNDQYAEIEQVRQVEIHGTVKAAQASGGVDATLAERQSQYGCYEDVAYITQEILKALRISGYDRMPATHKESMHMIASKMARLVCGDCNSIDGWHDIGGYSKLIEKLIKGE